jgi:hypothetical protein
MSAGTNTNYEARITRLEETLNWLIGYARDTNKLARDALQKALGSGTTMFPGGGGVKIFMAYAPSGIPCASVTGTAPNFVVSPNSGSCYVFQRDNSGLWQYVATTTVFNDYPNSTGAGVASGHWVQVAQDPDGTLRVVGEQC